jgi:hypothetical protein
MPATRPRIDFLLTRNALVLSRLRPTHEHADTVKMMNTANDYIANIAIAHAAYLSSETNASMRPKIE